jgi:Membrane protein TerC, possibly involved in tellurium resistance
MEWIADPTIWAGLATLVVLEIVLGIDNLVFIAILADKLPKQQRDKARVVGLLLALVMRLALLASISWLATLTKPMFIVTEHPFSGRDLIMLVGGIFLLFKATMELNERLEGKDEEQHGARKGARFWPVVAQIVVLDAVFFARLGDHRGRHGRPPGGDDDRGLYRHRPDAASQQAADALRQRTPDYRYPVPELPVDDRL